MMVVSIAEARAHIRMEANYPDDQVLPYLAAAVEAAESFLGRTLYASLDELAAAVLAGTAGVEPMVITPAIRAAILLIFGQLHEDREDGTGAIALTSTSRALLQRHRIGTGI